MVTDPALSPALNLTVPTPPLAVVKAPFPLVMAQVAEPGFTVRSTSSPTPILVLALLAGEVATVTEVMVQHGGSPA